MGLVLVKKQFKRAKIMYSRTTHGRGPKCFFSLQKKTIIEDVQQNVYPVILFIILPLFIVSCSCLLTLKDFGSVDWRFDTSWPHQKYQ